MWVVFLQRSTQSVRILIQKIGRNLVDANEPGLMALTLPLSILEHIPLRLATPHIVSPLGLRLMLAGTL